MRKIIRVLSVLLVIIILGACSSNQENKISNNWEEIVNKAKNQSITFYGWGGDPKVNQYVDTIASKLKAQYNITIKRVDMMPPDYLDIISTEKEANKDSAIDVVWINGNNFKLAKDKDLLMKDVTTYLPNMKFVDENSKMISIDFGTSTDRIEAPFGSTQFILIKNNSRAKNVVDTKTLLEYVKNNKNRFTYPDVSNDFTGSAFVRNVIVDIIGEDKYYSITKDKTKEEVYDIIKPALNYLNEIKTYLWREGKTYPQSSTILDNMYADAEVDFTMSYSPFHAASFVKNKEFNKDTSTIILGNKSIGNTHFLSIASNSAHKEASLVFINEVLSIENQLLKYDPYGWGDFPVFDINKLDDSQTKQFNSYQIPSSVLGYEYYQNKSVSELDASITIIIDELWKEHVLNK